MNKFFDFLVRSDIAFNHDELMTSVDADITIHREDNKTCFTEPNSASSFTLNIPNTAQFHIQQGNTINYIPHATCTEDDLRLYLLGSCMGALLQQRGFIVLHGNAVTWDNETCTIFIGESGSGKSTTAAWHYLQGASIVTDDVCAIRFDAEGRPVIRPSYPQIKLWQTSADLLELSTQNLKRVRQPDDKFRFPISTRFAQKPCVVKHTIELNPEAVSKQRVSGAEKVLCLQRHSYRYHFLPKMGLECTYMQQLMRLAQHVELDNMPRPIIHTSIREKNNV